MIPAAPAPAARFGTAWRVAVGVAVTAVALAALAPFAPPGPRSALMALFDPLCHQIPARSFAVDGVAFALCHRCFGVAVGVAAGLLVAPTLGPVSRRDDGRRGLHLLALAALPMAADWGLDVLGAWVNTPASRLATGAAFGVCAGLVLARALATPPRRAVRGGNAPDVVERGRALSGGSPAARPAARPSPPA